MQIVASYLCYQRIGDHPKLTWERAYDRQERSQADTVGGKLLKT